MMLSFGGLLFFVLKIPFGTSHSNFARICNYRFSFLRTTRGNGMNYSLHQNRIKDKITVSIHVR